MLVFFKRNKKYIKNMNNKMANHTYQQLNLENKINKQAE